MIFFNHFEINVIFLTCLFSIFVPRNFSLFPPITIMGGVDWGPVMLPPDIIEKLKRERQEREERERPSLRLPLYPPHDESLNRRINDEEPTNASRVIVIEL